MGLQLSPGFSQLSPLLLLLLLPILLLLLLLPHYRSSAPEPVSLATLAPGANQPGTESLGHFNRDILELVLSKLQATDLVRMKLVSRGWRDLISDRSFALQHCRQRQQPPSLSGFLFQQSSQWSGFQISDVCYISRRGEEEPTKVVQRSVDSIPEGLEMAASCNGLICCKTSSSQNGTLSIHVGNPLTREWFKFDWSCSGGRAAAIGLVFDPCRDLTHSSTNFKVVMVWEEEGRHASPWFAFHVYSSETGSWRVSDVMCRHRRYALNVSKCVPVEGVLYWLGDGDEILVFDMENELAYVVPTPIPDFEFAYEGSFGCVGESDGEVQYVMASSTALLIWVPKDLQKGKWSLKDMKSLTDLDKVLDVFLRTSFQLWDRWLQDTHEEELVESSVRPLQLKDGVLILKVLNGIFLYSTRDGGVNHIADTKGFCNMDLLNPDDVLPYSMSLVPLNRQ